MVVGASFAKTDRGAKHAIGRAILDRVRTGNTGTSYTDANATDLTRCIYRVRARNAANRMPTNRTDGERP